MSHTYSRRGRRRWYSALAVSLVGAMAVFLLGTAGPAAAATVLTEDFENGAPSGWTKSGGDWHVAPDGGSQVFKQSKTDSELARQLGGDASWRDYSVQARVKPDTLAGSSSFAALGARASSATRMYRVALYPNRAELQSVNGGQVSTIGTRSLTSTAGTWHTLALTVNGGTVSATVNGQTISSTAHSAWTQGRIALVTSNAAASFDDVLVTSDGVPPDPTNPDPTNPDPTNPDPTNPDPTNPDPTNPPDPTGPVLYAAPGGRADAAGTQSDPTTVPAAISRVTPGGTIYLRGGTYNYAQPIVIQPGNNGSSGARTILTSYPGETPVLNFSAMSEDPANRGLSINGSYWYVYGITVERAGDNGIFVGGSNNIIERTITRFNRDSGLQISRVGSTTPNNQWPSHNLVLSAVSHDNADSDGEDADGFAAKLTSGPGNVFRYAVAHNNIDDGWDLYTKRDTGPIGAVTIEDSLAYNNGTLSNGTQNPSGDRNGFKLGGEDIGVNHTIHRNIAFNNGKHGFTYNRNLGTMSVRGNVSINSKERNFQFDGGTSVFRDNVSCHSGSGSNDRTIGNVDSSNQFWSGSNGPKCSAYTGTLGWSFNADGSLRVTFGGTVVKP
ncbi:LamG-like jellyroll fold domain-containing protein [Streptomyces otsuchiensis]|uniref:LamG-like jellyroll fold domain-containing protein n=1 Tax=Streptomyces otsuchiensis TaxID=2681388 RepID=UPI001D1307F0|nr:LamG-like jellyroll fold domain-containing protein [Streptomyces otsuchiensis]